jgi:hypothetical protein
MVAFFLDRLEEKKKNFLGNVTRNQWSTLEVESPNFGWEDPFIHGETTKF